MPLPTSSADLDAQDATSTPPPAVMRCVVEGDLVDITITAGPVEVVVTLRPVRDGVQLQKSAAMAVANAILRGTLA